MLVMFPNLLNSFSLVRYDDERGEALLIHLLNKYLIGISHVVRCCARSRGCEEDCASTEQLSLLGDVISKRQLQGRVGLGEVPDAVGAEKGALSIPLPTPAMSEEQLPIKAKDHHSRKTRIS